MRLWLTDCKEPDSRYVGPVATRSLSQLLNLAGGMQTAVDSVREQVCSHCIVSQYSFICKTGLGWAVDHRRLTPCLD